MELFYRDFEKKNSIELEMDWSDIFIICHAQTNICPSDFKCTIIFGDDLYHK